MIGKRFYWWYKIFRMKKRINCRNIILKEGFDIADIRNVEFGDYIYIGDNFKVWGTGKLKFRENVIIGPNVTIMTSNHNFKEDIQYIPYDSKNIDKTTIINSNVWIGANVSIVPGVTIGEGAIVGMGSVVTKDVDPLTIVGGNPASKIGEREKEKYYELKLKNRFYLKHKFKS